MKVFIESVQVYNVRRHQYEYSSSPNVQLHVHPIMAPLLSAGAGWIKSSHYPRLYRRMPFVIVLSRLAQCQGTCI